MLRQHLLYPLLRLLDELLLISKEFAIAFCPSEFDYSFVQLGGPTDINPWLTNYFVSLGIGYRF